LTKSPGVSRHGYNHGGRRCRWIDPGPLRGVRWRGGEEGEVVKGGGVVVNLTYYHHYHHHETINHHRARMVMVESSHL